MQLGIILIVFSLFAFLASKYMFKTDKIEEDEDKEDLEILVGMGKGIIQIVSAIVFVIGIALCFIKF